MIEEKEKELFSCAYAIALMAVRGVEPSEKLKAEFESKNAAYLKALNDSFDNLKVRIDNIKNEVSNGYNLKVRIDNIKKEVSNG